MGDSSGSTQESYFETSQVSRKDSTTDHIFSNALPILRKDIFHSERVSSNRFHQEVKLASADDIDAILLGWLKTAYEMSG